MYISQVSGERLQDHWSSGYIPLSSSEGWTCLTSLLLLKVAKGSLTIWPVYAYTLAAQNTVIKLLSLILSVENNTSMSCEDIYAKIFVYYVII